MMGWCSIGAHVRDAAAYVCWATAKAYPPDILFPVAQALAPALLTAACYDREVGLGGDKRMFRLLSHSWQHTKWSLRSFRLNT